MTTPWSSNADMAEYARSLLFVQGGHTCQIGQREKRHTHVMMVLTINEFILLQSNYHHQIMQKNSLIYNHFGSWVWVDHFFFCFFQYLCSIALKASKILPICCPALDISIYFPFPSGIDPHHQFLPDPFFLRIQDAVCWVIEMGETWWEIKQLFQLNLESLFTDFCKAPQQSIHNKVAHFLAGKQETGN